MSELCEDTITINKGNSSATVHLFGATLISWKPKDQECLFVSKKSKFDKQKPIRGGIPVVFPHFGPWKNGPQHGFARKMMWSVSDKSSDSVKLILEDSKDSREIWDYRFLFEYTISLISDSEIKMDAVIINKDSKNFDFTFLLHTYFAVDDATKCKLKGLKDCAYIDKVKNVNIEKEVNEEISISQLTDNIYLNTPPVHKLYNASEGKTVEIQKSNLPDTVVWNPWIENAKKMDDFGDDEYKNMICVEAGYVAKPYMLEPGKNYGATQILKLYD